MKSRSSRSLRRLQLKIKYYCDYADQICQLEKALARKPEKLQLDIIGSGELAPDTALLMRSILLGRFPKTHLITNARSSLQNGAVLVWMMGETRLIREDAKLFFRKSTKAVEDDNGDDWKGEMTDDCEIELEEVDYIQVLKYIDHFLPVKELVGRALDRQLLREYGLVDHEKMDQFLTFAFRRLESTDDRDKPGPHAEPQKLAPKFPTRGQTKRRD